MCTYGWSCAIAHCPTFFEQPIPFTYIPFIHCTFITHFKNLRVNFAEWTFLGFKNDITDHTSQAVGNSIFMFSCKDYSECEVGEYMFPLTYRRWLTFTGNTCVTCMATICYQFFLSRRALYIRSQPFPHTFFPIDNYLTIIQSLKPYLLNNLVSQHCHTILFSVPWYLKKKKNQKCTIK